MSLQLIKQEAHRLQPVATCRHCLLVTRCGLLCLWCGELVWAPPQDEGTDNTLSAQLSDAGYGSGGVM